MGSIPIGHPKKKRVKQFARFFFQRSHFHPVLTLDKFFQVPDTAHNGFYGRLMQTIGQHSLLLGFKPSLPLLLVVFGLIYELRTIA